MLNKLLPALILACLTPLLHAETFTLSSDDFKPAGMLANTQVFNGFGCTGENISPALSWKNPPPGTQSFALLVHDPDAPTGGSGWWHWLMVNIPATTTTLAADAGKTDKSKTPAGAVQIKTDYGTAGWGGPCPPMGDKPHAYHFTLHALKTKHLDIPADASAALVGYMVNANSIGKATLTGFFGREK